MKLLKVGITHGDINGISLELITKALSAPELLEFCTPIVFSDEACFMQTAKLFEFEQPIPLEVISSARQAMDGRVNLVNACSEHPQLAWGEQTETSLKAEADSLNAAVDAFKSGLIDILICAPGQLDNSLDSHALSDFVKQASGSENPVFDWVINDQVRILKLQPVAYTTELGEGFAIESFKNDIKSINAQLREDFGFIRPRMALLSSNSKLSNTIQELQEEGLTIFGPMDNEKFVAEDLCNHYDAVICQDVEETRHTIISKLNKENTIGYVSGMPIILSYPFIGVEYNIAGMGNVDDTSFRNAIYTALDIHRNRHRYHEATRHPLEKQWIPKGRDDFKLDLTKEEA